MRAIVTRENPDGTFDNVGIFNRTITKAYKTEQQLLRYGVTPYAETSRSGWVRVEVFRRSIYGEPDDVFTYNHITRSRGLV